MCFSLINKVYFPTGIVELLAVYNSNYYKEMKATSQVTHYCTIELLSVLESKSLDDTDFEDVQFLYEKLKLSLQDLK